MPGAIVEEEKPQFESIKEQLKHEKEEDVVVEDEEDDDDEDDEDFGGEGEVGNEYSKPSRSEKKSRKALLKLGMKPISDVSSVEFRRAKNVFYVISNPAAYKSPNADTYVFFGEAKLDDLSSQLQTQAAQRFKTPDMLPNDASQASMAPLAEEEDEDDVDDDGGFEAGDIDLVMTQAGISKAKAVKALKANDGDIVSAIMELTL